MADCVRIFQVRSFAIAEISLKFIPNSLDSDENLGGIHTKYLDKDG
jgi:hypothetical protein